MGNMGIFGALQEPLRPTSEPEPAPEPGPTEESVASFSRVTFVGCREGDMDVPWCCPLKRQHLFLRGKV